MSPRLDVTKVKADARGKWAGILSSCGVDKGYLTAKHGPCPICQDGKDRFRFDDKDGEGTFYCAQCGAGDGLSLLQRMTGWDFGKALREVADLSGQFRAVKVRTGRDDKEVREEMNAIWRAAKPLAEVEATRRWWERRLGALPTCPDLRAVRSLRCSGAPDHAAMVALIRGMDGKPVSLHRTYLKPDGEKADIAEPRRVMDIQMPKGCAVRLAEPTEHLGVAEGIETAESCRIMFGVPTWALLNAGNMKGFVPPPYVRRVTIFGEVDSSFTGQAAAFELARSLWAMRKKWEPHLEVAVSMHGLTIDPMAWDRDWNDVLQVRLASEGKAA